MSSNLQSLLRDALLNNTYDYSVMHNTLKNTWLNSFSYLYTQQKSYVEYEELFYFSNDTETRNSKRIGHLYLDKSLYANFDVDYDIIHVCDREEYRRSKFYQNEFTVKDISYNPNIFLKMPIVIIDDKVIWDYKIKITKDCTRFILPFKRNFVIRNERNTTNDDIIYIDHKIQVLIVDNTFYQRFTMNKSNLYFNASNKTITIPKSSMESMITTNVSYDTNDELKKEWNLSSVNNMNDTQKSYRDKLVSKRMKYMKVPTQTGTMMCSIHFPNSGNRSYELGTFIIPFKFSNNQYVANLTDDIVEIMNSHNRNVYISIWFMNRLYHHTFYNGKTYTTATNNGADLLVVQESEMRPYSSPIPVEDFMVFKKDSSKKGYTLEKNTEMLEMHYPNIYRIKDSDIKNNNIYDIYYFYHKNDDLKYTVLFDFYFTFLKDLFTGQKIEKIINDIYYNRDNLSGYTNEQKAKFTEVFNKIYQYQYYTHKYGESDFINRYKVIPANSDKVPVEYKDETLKEWIKIDQWVLRDYVKEQNKLGSSYHLFTNTIDLSTRRRTNTSLEIPNSNFKFDETRYVFAFNNERQYPELLDVRIFVDGLLVKDLYQDRYLFMDYFYIPANLVTNDSYIEIEVFPRYTFSQDVIFTSTSDEKVITIADSDNSPFSLASDIYIDSLNPISNYTYSSLDTGKTFDFNSSSFVVTSSDSDVILDRPDKDIFPTIPDVYFENKSNSNRIDISSFNITASYNVGEYKYETTDKNKPVKFTRISKFKIKPKDSSVVNKPLSLKINKRPVTVSFKVSRSGFMVIKCPENEFKYDADYMRVFRNGRLIPRCKYEYKILDNQLIIKFFEFFDKDDFIYIDITPYKYKEIYHKEELTPNDTLIDLRGIINKPFDIRYYDVYMNGRKLSFNNVFSISPWLITLVNLKSNYNLTIYERERDWEYFGLDYTQNIYYYTISDLFESGIVKDDVKNKMLLDIINNSKDDRLNIVPNTNNEVKEDVNPYPSLYVEYDVFYFDELIPHTYMNPDVLQENSKWMQQEFETIYNTYKRNPYDTTDSSDMKNRRKNYPNIICLDPDLLFKEIENSNAILVYDVGHMSDNISNDILNTSIDIPDEGNIDK